MRGFGGFIPVDHTQLPKHQRPPAQAGSPGASGPPTGRAAREALLIEHLKIPPDKWPEVMAGLLPAELTELLAVAHDKPKLIEAARRIDAAASERNRALAEAEAAATKFTDGAGSETSGNSSPGEKTLSPAGDTPPAGAEPKGEGEGTQGSDKPPETPADSTTATESQIPQPAGGEGANDPPPEGTTEPVKEGDTTQKPANAAAAAPPAAAARKTPAPAAGKETKKTTK